MRKTICLAMAVIMSVFLLSGCGGSGQGSELSEAELAELAKTAVEGDFDTIHLRLSCNGTDTSTDAKTAKLFADKLKQKSGGKITVTIFPNDQLSGGNMSKGLEMLCNGTVDIDIHSTSIIASLDNSLMVSTLPWLFSDYQAAEDAYYGTGGEYINSVLEEKGLYYLGAVHNGFKAMTNGKHPIEKPEDLKGLKMRIPGGDFFSAFYSAFGASPQAMSWSEVFTALQQGTIDGHDNSLSTINSANVQEVQKYFTISRHTYEAFTFMANGEKFDSYTEDTQNLIRQCVEEATKEINQQIIIDEEALEKKFVEENGCEIYTLEDADVEEFKAVVKPVIDKYKGIYGQEACEAFGVE